MKPVTAELVDMINELGQLDEDESEAQQLVDNGNARVFAVHERRNSLIREIREALPSEILGK